MPRTLELSERLGYPSETRTIADGGRLLANLGENEAMRALLSSLVLILLVPAALPDGNDKDDPSTWMPVKIAGEQAAPEFEDVTAWINSKPLSMKGLKGKVVVVHFMAFG